MSPDRRLMCGLSLILIPTIVYGGLTVVGVVSNRFMGTPGPSNLSATQIAFYRADEAKIVGQVGQLVLSKGGRGEPAAQVALSLL